MTQLRCDQGFELLARRALGEVPEYFRLDSFRVFDARRWNAQGELVTLSEATVKLEVGGARTMAVSEGNGPGLNSGAVMESLIGDALEAAPMAHLARARGISMRDITLGEVLDVFGKRLVIIVTELDTGRERRLTPDVDPSTLLTAGGFVRIGPAPGKGMGAFAARYMSPYYEIGIYTGEVLRGDDELHARVSPEYFDELVEALEAEDDD